MPEITLKNLTDEEILKIAGPEAAALRKEGADVTLIIEINNIDKTVSNTDKQLVKTALQKKNKDAAAFLYLDISVYVAVGEADPVKLTELNGQDLMLTMTIPEKQQNKQKNVTRTFYVVRVHGDKADILAEGTKTSQTFKSSLFSTYAAASSDKENSSVKTSDESHLGLWIGLLALLIIGAAAFNAVRRKKSK